MWIVVFFAYIVWLVYKILKGDYTLSDDSNGNGSDGNYWHPTINNQYRGYDNDIRK